MNSVFDRRQFLKVAGAAWIPVLCSSELFVWAEQLALDKNAVNDGPFIPAAENRFLLLIELKGGNDGLNTVVPYADDNYRRLRPRLGLEKDSVLRLDDEHGFHPALEPLVGSWASGDLGVVLGVGYPQPNRSHFRSIEIWETGTDADEYRGDGWLARVRGAAPGRDALAADGLVLGRGGQGPLAGPQLRTVVMDDPERFTRVAKGIPSLPDHGQNAALAHLLEVRRELRHAASVIEERRRKVPDLGVKFPNGRFGKDLRIAAELIAGGVPVPVIKVALSGFDTHANQKGVHERLLGELAKGLAAFQAAMVKCKLQDHVIAMTYSEFGRRPAENGSRGTDHGTAAPHFVLGTQVRGGLLGNQPSLLGLDTKKDMTFTVDYRSLYATVAREWWKLPAAALADSGLQGAETLKLFQRGELY